MSKIDEIRRQREALQGKKSSDASSNVVPIRPGVVVSPTKSETNEEEGKCSVCGKLKPLLGGVVAQHQKGLGKMCPGSRKAPA